MRAKKSSETELEMPEDLPGTEIVTDIIAHKQTWFDRPGLILMARELNGEEFSIAMGIKNGASLDSVFTSPLFGRFKLLGC